jgi:hypothetical protein
MNLVDDLSDQARMFSVIAPIAFGTTSPYSTISSESRSCAQKSALHSEEQFSSFVVAAYAEFLQTLGVKRDVVEE